MTDSQPNVTDTAEANSGDVSQSETVTEGMQGADGNVDANGLDRDLTEDQKAQKLSELRNNLGTDAAEIQEK